MAFQLKKSIFSFILDIFFHEKHRLSLRLLSNGAECRALHKWELRPSKALNIAATVKRVDVVAAPLCNRDGARALLRQPGVFGVLKKICFWKNDQNCRQKHQRNPLFSQRDGIEDHLGQARPGRSLKSRREPGAPRLSWWSEGLSQVPKSHKSGDG